MLNHGFVTGALFLLVGIQYEKTHRRNDRRPRRHREHVAALHDLLRSLRARVAGLPGLNGFVGEFLVLIGSFKFSGVPLAGSSGARPPRSV